MFIYVLGLDAFYGMTYYCERGYTCERGYSKWGKYTDVEKDMTAPTKVTAFTITQARLVWYTFCSGIYNTI